MGGTSGQGWNGGFEGCLLPLILFPLLVERFLVVCKQGLDLLVGLLVDGAAVAGVGAVVAGGVFPCAVDGDVAVDEDHLELEDLVLVEVELVFEGFELFCGLLGGRGFGSDGAGGIGVLCVG